MEESYSFDRQEVTDSVQRSFKQACWFDINQVSIYAAMKSKILRYERIPPTVSYISSVAADRQTIL